ncbi:MAG: hypothetical protein WDZ52_03465 [Pseudohongiellaceae bacterium]
MNRRSFIFFTDTSNGKVVDLSCETLYMHIMDIQTASSIAKMGQSTVDGNNWVSDEPAAYLATSSIETLFRDLQFQLSSCKKLRVFDSSWVLTGLIKNEMETLMANFRELGGEIEFVNNADKLNTVSN